MTKCLPTLPLGSIPYPWPLPWAAPLARMAFCIRITLLHLNLGKKMDVQHRATDSWSIVLILLSGQFEHKWDEANVSNSLFCQLLRKSHQSSPVCASLGLVSIWATLKKMRNEIPERELNLTLPCPSHPRLACCQGKLSDKSNFRLVLFKFWL